MVKQINDNYKVSSQATVKKPYWHISRYTAMVSNHRFFVFLGIYVDISQSVFFGDGRLGRAQTRRISCYYLDAGNDIKHLSLLHKRKGTKCGHCLSPEASTNNMNVLWLYSVLGLGAVQTFAFLFESAAREIRAGIEAHGQTHLPYLSQISQISIAKC